MSLDIQRDLSFGVLAARSNVGVSTCRVLHRGQPVSSVSGAGGLLMIVPGEPGRYLFRGLPANAPVQITVVERDGLRLGGQGEALRLSAFTFDEGTSNAGGELLFLLGATLATSATGHAYQEGVYYGAVDIELSYWSQPDQAYVKPLFGVTVQVELQSSIAMEQLQPLNFGAMSAFSHSAQRASLRLSPTGAVSLSNSTLARIISIGGASPGRIRVSGAAPLQALNVSFDPPTVVLQHRFAGSQSARFEVRDFTYYPAGVAFHSDVLGNLEFSVGATLDTSLTSSIYQDGEYVGIVTVRVDY